MPHTPTLDEKLATLVADHARTATPASEMRAWLDKWAPRYSAAELIDAMTPILDEMARDELPAPPADPLRDVHPTVAAALRGMFA